MVAPKLNGIDATRGIECVSTDFLRNRVANPVQNIQCSYEGSRLKRDGQGCKHQTARMVSYFISLY